MLDTIGLEPPAVLEGILADTEAAGFSMFSEGRTGALLRVLAASRPAARILELGTGTGVATAWLLDGMGRNSHLLSVDNDDEVLRIAKRHLGKDTRATFELRDGEDLIRQAEEQGWRYDLIFADTWPGKFSLLEDALGLLDAGGLYVVDDLLMQPSWPEDHASKVFDFLTAIGDTGDVHVVRLNWSSGILIATKPPN